MVRDQGIPSEAASSGRAIVEALGGTWSPRGGMCRCPAHADRSPSLSIRPGRRRLLFHCFAGCNTRDVLDALAALRLPGSAAWKQVADIASTDIDRGRSAAARIWSEARPLIQSPGQRYLAQRGIAICSPALRFHPRTPHGRSPLTRFAPAMIAAVRDEAGLTAIHRTFLDVPGNGLALLDPPKCALGRLGTGLVRLAPEGEILGLAEGIETALSATMLSGIPCWATLGTERFGRIAIPAGVRRLVLFLDHDAGGRRAEMLTREALGQSRDIEARYPDANGADWNDVLRRTRPTRPIVQAVGGEAAG